MQIKPRQPLTHQHAFRQLKSELAMGPIYHWKDRRIRAHIMICFLAFCLKVILFKKLREKNKKASYNQAIEALKSLQAIDLKIQGKRVVIRTEACPMINEVFRSIGMRLPNRILNSEFDSSVVIRS